MLVQEVMIKYHKILPFPWSPRKIKKAGFSTSQLLLKVGRELEQCSDINTPIGNAVITLIKDLDLLGTD